MWVDSGLRHQELSNPASAGLHVTAGCLKQVKEVVAELPTCVWSSAGSSRAKGCTSTASGMALCFSRSAL